MSSNPIVSRIANFLYFSHPQNINEMSSRRGSRARTAPVPAHSMVRRSARSASAEVIGTPRANRGSSATAYGEEDNSAFRSGVVNPLSSITLARGLSGDAAGGVSSSNLDAIAEELTRSPSRVQAKAERGVSSSSSASSSNQGESKRVPYGNQAVRPVSDSFSYGNDHENGLLAFGSFSRDGLANHRKPPVPAASMPVLGKRVLVTLGFLLFCATVFLGLRWSQIPPVNFVDNASGPRLAPSDALFSVSASNHEMKNLHESFNSCKRDIKMLTERVEILDKHVKERMEERVQTLDDRVWPQRANFFSPILGAVVDPSHTSPTLRRSEGLRSRLYHTVFRDPAHSPPIRALTPWTENGDCWCAAESRDGGGRLSIGVWIRFDIIPTGITIEHPEANMAIDSRSAPKDLELWVRVARKDKHVEIDPYLVNNGIGCESPRPHTRGNWICLHKWSYNAGIQTPYAKGGHIQRSQFRVQPEFSIDKAVIRVMQNWGKGHTCLYQIKMDGIVSE